jgi:hypothetical protein
MANPYQNPGTNPSCVFTSSMYGSTFIQAPQPPQPSQPLQPPQSLQSLHPPYSYTTPQGIRVQVGFGNTSLNTATTPAAFPFGAPFGGSRVAQVNQWQGPGHRMLSPHHYPAQGGLPPHLQFLNDPVTGATGQQPIFQPPLTAGGQGMLFQPSTTPGGQGAFYYPPPPAAPSRQGTFRQVSNAQGGQSASYQPTTALGGQSIFHRPPVTRYPASI